MTQRYLLGTGFIFSTWAMLGQSIVLPHWERAKYEATMTERDEGGHEMNIGFVKNLTLNINTTRTTPTSFSFCEEKPCTSLVCPPTPKCRNFVIQSETSNRCKNAVYIASENQNAPSQAKMKVIEQRGRACYANEKTWKAYLTETDGKVRYFEGEPKGVMNILED